MSPDNIKLVEAQVRDAFKDGDLVTEIMKELKLTVPLSSLYLVRVSSNDDRVPTHNVGVVVDDTGEYWIVGDSDSCYKASETTHKCLVYNRLDQKVLGEPAWMDGKPW